MKLITESIEDAEVITEAVEGKTPKLYIVGTFLQGECVNRNRRFYSASLLEREANRYVNESINQGRSYGELGHPEGPKINLERVSHMIKELKRDGNNWVGKAIVADTPYGNIAKGLIDIGAKLGVSSRGMGSLKPDAARGCDVVQDDYHLAVGADIVATPSAPDAFVNGIMESHEWIYNAAKGTWVEEQIDPLRATLRKMSINEINDYKLSAFENFCNALVSGSIHK